MYVYNDYDDEEDKIITEQTYIHLKSQSGGVLQIIGFIFLYFEQWELEGWICFLVATFQNKSFNTQLCSFIRLASPL